MKIKSVRSHCCIGNYIHSNTQPCPDCRPGRWYDEKTARLMERAIRLVIDDKPIGDWGEHVDKWNSVREQWAKLTEKKTAN